MGSSTANILYRTKTADPSFFPMGIWEEGVILSQKGKKKNQELEKPESQIKPQHTVEPTIHTIPSQY